MEHDLLGTLLVETMKFYDSKFDPSMVLHDETTSTEPAAGELFT